jgi:molybdenum cofactor cytidylyltransferase
MIHADMRQHGGVSAIVLAAGRARRFGSDKRLADFGGEPLLMATLRTVQAVLPDPLVVLGPHDALLQAVLAQHGIASSLCLDAELGMGHSLAHGVRQRPSAAGWLVLLGDMPCVAPATLRSLVAAITPDGIVAPSCHGQRGNPAGFGRTYFDQLCALHGDVGARPLLSLHRDKLRLLPCEDRGVLADVDTPQMLQQRLIHRPAYAST